MAVVNIQGPTLAAGNNKLVSGTARKTWNSNKKLIAKLIFTELISNFNPPLALAVGVYRTLGSKKFIQALTVIINVPLYAAGFRGLDDDDVGDIVDDLGGAAKVADAIEQVNTGFQKPQSGYLYAFKQKELNIPSGEYTRGAIWRSNNQLYILDDSREWISNVDWIAGVPNLSWLGDWFVYDSNANSFNPMSARPSVLNPEYKDYDLPKASGNGNGNGGGGGSGSGNGDDKEADIFPLIAAGIGFLVAGPLGAGAGLLMANLGKK